jgi:NAD+ diphosphatase
MIPRLDRSEARRADPHVLAMALVDPESRFVLFCGDRAFLRHRMIDPVVCTGEQVRGLGTRIGDAVLLGYDAKTAWFALDIGDRDRTERDERGADERLLRRGEFVELRSIQEPVDVGAWALLSQARALLAWNRAQAHCPACGAPTIARAGGHLRVCSDSGCGRIQFPRTDPAIIVRVLFEDRCLLARQPRFHANLRSVIAGFVEPGESLEGGVRREVSEEIGVEVGDVRYLGSQPWPFPMSLMVAFEARAQSGDIRIDEDELEAADWYTRDCALREIGEGRLVLPSRKSIARRMIDGWLEGRADI